MTLRVSGKHVDIGESFREHITESIDTSVGKYFNGNYHGHVTLAREGALFQCDCTLYLDSGIVLHGSAKDIDPRASFHLLGERINKRLRRYKSRLRSHPIHTDGKDGGDGMNASAYIVESLDDREEMSDDYTPVIVAETEQIIRTLSVGNAVSELDFTGAKLVVFRNAASGILNVVYRRDDGNIGWIDPNLSAAEQRTS